MLVWTIIKVALRSLLSNKLRLILTMLGIVIGVAAVIGMLAIAEGAQQSVLDRFRAMGTNLLILRPNWDFRGGNTAEPRRMQVGDWHAVEQMTEYVAAVAPEAWDSVTARAGNKNTRVRVMGTTPSYFHVRNFPLAAGRLFAMDDVLRRADVCILGAQVAQDLFPDRDPVQQTVYLSDRRMTVIGVAEPKGDQGWFNPDSMVFAPLFTVMREIIGQRYLDDINITIHSEHLIGEAQAAIADLMRRRHRIPRGGQDDFRIDSQAALLTEAASATAIFKILLGGIASISLLVGGIGIMNIMLVTVTERTREIGIRKAMGGKRRDILLQFLIESLVIALMGGALGILGGVGIARAFDRFTQGSETVQFQTVITASSILLAVTCSSAIGLVFGLYPARRASRLDPIEALRHE